MLEKLKKLRKAHLIEQHGLSFYDYQNVISDQILKALIDNLQVTANATEEDVKHLKQVEIAGEISRQAGKTYAVGHTAEFILTWLPVIFKRPIRIGIFAGQLDQAKVSYNIMRNALRKNKQNLINISVEEQRWINEEENSKKLVLPDGSSATIAPINKTSLIEGLTLDLIIIDEAQDADDEVVKHSIWPMGKTTNAPRVYIGKAGTKIGHFYRLGQTNSSFKVYFNDVASQRRKLYEETGDVRHLIYETSVKEDIVKYGEDADFIQREYFGKWQIGTGQFTTIEELEKLVSDRKQTFHCKNMDCFIGIDTAKNPDSTVVTVVRYNPDTKKKELINWMELRGENYKSQFDLIVEFIRNYKVAAIAIDSTGQGDFMPDMFQSETEWADEYSGLYRIKFSAVSKDQIYKNLKVSIKELLTTLPELSTSKGEKFRQQLLDLQQEYKGQLLSVHHPDTQDGHDDYPDSWALAEWAYAKWNENKAEINVLDMSPEPERKVDRDDKGKVVNYWPGLD